MIRSPSDLLWKYPPAIARCCYGDLDLEEIMRRVSQFAAHDHDLEDMLGDIHRLIPVAITAADPRKFEEEDCDLLVAIALETGGAMSRFRALREYPSPEGMLLSAVAVCFGAESGMVGLNSALDIVAAYTRDCRNAPIADLIALMACDMVVAYPWERFEDLLRFYAAIMVIRQQTPTIEPALAMRFQLCGMPANLRADLARWRRYEEPLTRQFLRMAFPKVAMSVEETQRVQEIVAMALDLLEESALRAQLPSSRGRA